MYKGNICATGTPVRNSLAELLVMKRCNQRDILEDMGLLQFDDWASAFAVIDSELEIPPEGTGFRDRTRFLRFHNLPELMSVFHQSADIKLIDELDIKLPTLQNGKPTTVIVEPSEFVVKYIGELAVQADQIR